MDFARDDRKHVYSPEGPFLARRRNLFFETVERAAAVWTGDTTLGHRTAGESVHRMLVPDLWGLFLDVVGTDGGLSVRVQGTTRRALWVTAAYETGIGKRCEVVSRLREGRADIEFDAAPSRVALYLMDDSSTCYDRVDVYSFRLVPGASLYSEEYRAAATLHEDLDQARRRGEGPETEFKEWFLPTRTDKKSEELIRTAVSFSNTRGGTIYIAVNDTLEVVGIQRELERSYGKAAGGDPTALRKAYEEALGSWIIEGVRPRIEPEFRWIEQAGLIVLRVCIPEGTHKPYQLAQRGDVFVRRGSRNVKPEPGEITEDRRSGTPEPRWRPT